MRVLVVVEGMHESGGAVRALIKQLRHDLIDLEFDKLANATTHVHGKGRGYFKKAIGWMREARKRGFGAVILLVDRDQVGERLNEITDAQNHTSICDSPRALGVAVEAFDAWMLADQQALSGVLGVNIQTQPDPESIAHPKQHFKDLLAELGAASVDAGLYARIAEKLDISILATRCPRNLPCLQIGCAICRAPIVHFPQRNRRWCFIARRVVRPEGLFGNAGGFQPVETQCCGQNPWLDPLSPRRDTPAGSA